MIELTAIVSVLAGIALFILGLRHITAASIGIISAGAAPRLKDRNASALSLLSAGVRMAVGGSAGAAASAAVSFVNAGDLHEHKSPPLLAGVAMGSLVVALIVTVTGPEISTGLAAFVLLVLALPARQYGAATSSARSDIVMGAAFLLLGMEIAFHTGPGLVRPAVFIPLPWPAAIGAGLAIAALYRSSTGTIVLASALLASGMLAPTPAVLMALAGVPGAGLAFHLSTTRLQPGARVSSMVFLLLGTLSGLAGLLVWLIFTPPAVGVTPVVMVLAGHAVSSVVALIAPRHLCRIAGRLLKTRASKQDTENTDDVLSMLTAPLPETLDANLTITRTALGTMAGTAYEILMVVINLSQLPEDAEDAHDRIMTLRQENHVQAERISTALTKSARLRCTGRQAREITRQQQIAGELALIGDDCYKASRMMTRSYRKNYTVHKESADELFAYTSHILDFLRYISDTLGGRIAQHDPGVATEMEQHIDQQRDKLKKRARKTLQKNRDADVKGELAFIDVVSYLEHVADRCNAIAGLVRPD